MAAGRCSGCGQTDSTRKIRQHIVDCLRYIELYKQDPQQALSPEEEILRYHREDRTPEARAEQRGRRLHTRFAEITRQQQASEDRWACPPDILD